MRGPDSFTTNRSRALRKHDNDAEAALWSELRARRLNGFKLVRQHPIGSYFADFACREMRLVVEIDGSQHAGPLRDETRDAAMNDEGWSVVRFWAHEVLADRPAIPETLAAILEGRLNGPVKSFDMTFKPTVCLKDMP